MDRTKKPVVLIIDDDPNFLDLCRARLLKGYEIHMAFDGDEGIQMARALSPAAILLDLAMPRVSGIQVLEHMQAQKEFRSVPVLVMTTLRLDREQKASVSALANVAKFLEKTAALERLLEETERAVLIGQLYKATLASKARDSNFNLTEHPRPA